MQWTNEAIIINKKKFGENSAIITLITPEYGLFKGLVKYVNSKTKRGFYEAGNFVEATWRGRLAEQLGNFSCELMKNNSANILNNITALTALSAICAILEKTLPEREPNKKIYDDFKKLVSNINNSDDWHKDYIIFEINLLTELGFGLDLSCCAATGVTENLIYVSPKSGRAVSKEAGLPYKNKLLILPDFVKNSEKTPKNEAEIKNGLALSGFFLNKYIFKPHNINTPLAREQLFRMLEK